MHKLSARWKRLVLLLWLAPGTALVAADAVVIVADTRGQVGLQAWLSGLYNESLFHFALLTVVIIPATGAILGRLTDSLMSRLGVDLKSREVAER